MYGPGFSSSPVLEFTHMHVHLFAAFAVLPCLDLHDWALVPFQGCIHTHCVQPTRFAPSSSPRLTRVLYGTLGVIESPAAVTTPNVFVPLPACPSLQKRSCSESVSHNRALVISCFSHACHIKRRAL